jgi:hypothetical protein
MTRYRERREAGEYSADAAEAPTLVGPPTGDQLDAMSKGELLETATALGVSPANNAMTKDELREGIDAKLGGA